MSGFMKITKHNNWKLLDVYSATYITTIKNLISEVSFLNLQVLIRGSTEFLL